MSGQSFIEVVGTTPGTESAAASAARFREPLQQILQDKRLDQRGWLALLDACKGVALRRRSRGPQGETRILRAESYNTMDAARNVWAWAALTGRVAHDLPLQHEVFEKLLDAQQTHSREAWRRMGIDTADLFMSKQVVLQAALRRRVQGGYAAPARPSFSVLEPWVALWPNVFAHVCEADQVVRQLASASTKLAKLRTMSAMVERPWERMATQAQNLLLKDQQRPGNACHTVHMVNVILQWDPKRPETRPWRKRMRMKVRPPSCGPPPPCPQWEAVDERRVRCKRCGATVLKYTFKRHWNGPRCGIPQATTDAEARPPSKRGRWVPQTCHFCGKTVCHPWRHANDPDCFRIRAQSLKFIA